MNDQIKHTIMIVEDEPLLLEAISKKFQTMNMDIIPCTSAEEALEKLKTSAKLPDAIWLDYYLKGMDGLSFVHQLKEKTEWSQIPVIVVSNSASDDKVKNLLALGVDKYFLKAQYRLEDLIVEIKKIIIS